MFQRIRKSNEEGFTLIELLIVIIILGILAAIVVFAIGSTRKDAIGNSCDTDFKSIQLSLEAIKTKDGKYPAAGTGTPAQIGTNIIAQTTGTGAGTNNGALLQAWPGGSSTTVDDYVFTYSQTGGGTGYSISVQGKNVAGGTLTNASSKSAVDAACSGT